MHPKRLRGLLLFWLLATVVTGQEPRRDLFPFVADGKVGFIDSSGKEVVPPQFGNAGDASRFREGLANVGMASGWGYVDATGRSVVPGKYWWAHPFSEGLGAVQLPGEGRGWGFIDASGRLLIEGLRSASSFHDGLAAEMAGGKWGYLSRQMKMVIEPKFSHAADFHEGRAAIEDSRKWGYIDTQGKIVIKPQYDLAMPFSNGMGRVKILVRKQALPKGLLGEEGQTQEDVFYWGAVDPNGNQLIPPQFLDLTEFRDGYAFAIPDGSHSFGIVDHHGTFVVPPRFEGASHFSESVAAVKLGNRWGYVDASGEWVIPPSFDSAEPFENGLARAVARGGHYGYIDHSGHWVWRIDLRNEQEKTSTESHNAQRR